MRNISNLPRPRVRGFFLWKVSLIGGLGGILYGYDMGIIAAALLYLRTAFQLSTRMEETVVSIVLIGSLTGAITGGVLADRLGRRITLLLGALLFILGSALAAFAPSITALILARALLGVAIGFTSVTAPVYISELAPPHSRGRLIGLYQLALTLGIALADLTGYLLAPSHAWRAMFGFGALPALFFLVMIYTVPESPRWLLSNGRDDEAHRVLASYIDPGSIQSLLADLRLSLQQQTRQRWSALWTPAARRALLIAVGFTVLQQVTGVNTIIYYGPRIFSFAGFASDRSAILATLLIAVVNVLATVLALLLVDRLGRKPLLYVGIGGMTLSLCALSWGFHSASLSAHVMAPLALLSLTVYILCFAASMGPIAWILVAEVFPLRLRGRGAACATLGSGAANFLVSMTFLSLIQSAGNSITFLIYACFCVVTLLFVRFIVPETKGRELESISRESALR